MKKFKKYMLSIMAVLVIVFCGVFFAGCSSPAIVSIEKTSSVGYVDTYTITYSNGKTSTFEITNGKNGKDGKDGKDVSIAEIYQEYVNEYGEISYQDFLKQYLSVNTNGNASVINECLQSTLKVYTKFYETTTSSGFFGGQTQKSVAIYTGSAIIYKMYEDYTYVITNYHVVYDSKANSDTKDKIAVEIVGYLYGSEDSPSKKDTTTNGYDDYSYGDYAINFDYIGGSIENDIAVIRTKTTNITKINKNAKQVKLADKYYVGQTAIAIGNPEDEGISVTEGIVSVDNEYITLDIDGTSRYYRSIRIDTALYSGNSGGGLFNSDGELIGITNAGDNEDQNVNYAIPLSIATGVADNIIQYYTGSSTNAYKITLGIQVVSKNSKYTYDKSTGYGEISEDIVISTVEQNSIASVMGLKVGDTIKSMSINGKEYTLSRSFNIPDLLLTVRQNDSINFTVLRNNTQTTLTAYTVTTTNLTKIA